MNELIQGDRTRDYIMLMLGAPVLHVELHEDQLKLAIIESQEYVMNAVPAEHMEKNPVETNRLIRVGALGYAKLMLGRIRSKYKEGVPGPNPKRGIQLHGGELIEEGNRDISRWKSEVSCFRQAALSLPNE